MDGIGRINGRNQTVVGPWTKISKFTGVTNTHYIIHSDKQNFSINLRILIVWNENFSVSSFPVLEISLYNSHPQFRFIALHDIQHSYFPLNPVLPLLFYMKILLLHQAIEYWRCIYDLMMERIARTLVR